MKQTITTISQDRQKFLIKMGLFFESFGVTPVAGQILGTLMISEKSMSAKELEVFLEVAKSTVSTNLKSVLNMGLIEKNRMAGVRTDLYNFNTRMISNTMDTKLKSLTIFREYIDEALNYVENKERRQSLEEISEMYAFFQNEIPLLWSKWEKIRSNKFDT